MATQSSSSDGTSTAAADRSQYGAYVPLLRESPSREREQSCWGCGSPPPPDFVGCDMCVERKLAVCARFCSKACYKVNWERHKAWHAKKDAEMEKRRALEEKSLEAQQTRAEVYALNTLYSEVEERRFEEYAAQRTGRGHGVLE